MSERMQRILWVAVLAAAVGLTAATLWLVRYSRGLAVTGASRYGLIYMSDRDGDYRLYSCGALGENDRSLPASVSGDILPGCHPGSEEAGQFGSVAFLRITDSTRSAREVGMWGTVRVLLAGGREAITVSGTITRVLTVAPVWSPGGDRVAFAAVEDSDSDGSFSIGETGLYIAWLDGRPPAKVAGGCAEDTYLSWSPSGEMILFQTPTAVARLVDLSDGTVVSRDEHTTLACWSSDGQHIATYSTLDRRIHVLSIADGAEEYSVSCPDGHLTYLAWLPDEGTSAKWLALVSEDADESAGVLNTRTANADSGLTWQPLNQGSGLAFYPAVSPDGLWIAFNVVEHGTDPSLVVLRLGSKPVTLFADGHFSGLACWTKVANLDGW